MNKIYKLKYCLKTGSYVAVSEMAKGKTKASGKGLSLVGALVAMGLSTFVTAATEIPASYYNITTEQTIRVGNVYKYGADRAIGVGGTTVTLLGENGEVKIDMIANEGRATNRLVTWNAAAISSVGATQAEKILIAKDNVSVSHTPHINDSQGGGRHGVAAYYNANFTFEKALDIAIENLKASSSEHYAIVAGSGNDTPDKLGIDHYNKVTVNGDLNIAMSTENKNAAMTISGIRSIGGDRYNRSGVLQDSNSSGAVQVDGKTAINMNGAYAQGIYVSGGNSYITLHDSNITMNDGLYGSAALKIGKSRDINSENKGKYSFGAGKGTVTSTGAMNIDTTASNGVAIQIQETGSKLIANGSDASSTIRSKVGALTIGALDWTTHNDTIGIDVQVRNADWEAGDNDADLIKVSHGQKSALLEFNGEKTDLKSSSDGYLLAVDAKDSELTFNASDAGQMTGLVSKEANNFNNSNNANSSILNLNLADKFTWHLNKKDTITTTTFDNTTISKQAMINGGYAESDNDYTLKAVLSDGDKGTVTSNAGVINLTNKTPSATDKLTIDGHYTAENGALKLDTTIGDDASTTDLLVVTGNTSGTTDITITNVNGQGDLTEKGIKVVQVDGNSNVDSFSLIGDDIVSSDSITVGEKDKHKFTYRLYRGTDNHPVTENNGILSDIDPTSVEKNSWYLRSVCSSGSHTVSGETTSSNKDGLGCVTDDRIIVTTNAQINKVEGAGGVDTIEINGNAKVTGNVYGGSAGIDQSAEKDQGDAITIRDASEVMGDVDGQAGDDIINVSGNATVSGIIKGSEGDDSFIWSEGASIVGLDGGIGSDRAIVSSTKYDGSQKLDGGDDADIADGWVDTLNLNGVTVTANGDSIVNWEVIKLNNTDLILTSDLTTGKGITDSNVMGLHIGNDSILGVGNSLTIKGDVHNNNIIDFTKDNTPNQTLAIDGDYTGFENSKVLMNIIWNKDSDGISDILEIKGKAAGNSTVVAVKADGSENIIEGSVEQVETALNSIPVIKVGKSGESVFTGVAQTMGAGEAQLAKRTIDGIDEYYWTVMAIPSEPTPTPEPVPTPAPVPIYNPVVSAYTLAGKAGLELGYTALATLHERRGENQTLAWDRCGSCGEQAKYQTWVRVFGKYLELSGKTRLNTKHNIYGFQLGHDFSIYRTDEGGHRLTGGYISYGVMNSDYFDHYRAEKGRVVGDKYTSKSKQYGWNLGLTHTRYAPNGSYVDLVGQVGVLSNKITARNGIEAKQKGTALALSVEAGRPYALSEHKTDEGVWLIEPQAQLIYQMLRFKDFNDGIRQVEGGNHYGLRGRLGVRLAYNTQASKSDYRTNTFYLITNVLQDFKSSNGVKIGQDFIKETNAKTWVEIGLGGQLPLSKQSYTYADARYERNLSGAKREGYRGTIGIKYTWK